jgi:hypothetical protein
MKVSVNLPDDLALPRRNGQEIWYSSGPCELSVTSFCASGGRKR